MKKALVISGIVLFLAIGAVAIWLGGTTTLAEICRLNGEGQIVSVEMIPASKDTFRGTHTVYDSGEVYDRFISLFHQNRFAGKKLDGFLTVGIYECAKIVYHTDNGRQIAVIIPPEGAHFYLITDLYALQERQDYAFEESFCISFEEIERLARAGNE